ncbi:SIR2 family NAD-dependent protein deacylase [Consotaella salsifontis]|uniref:SIR2-like domain-containing protein n=1 Tax=Consotaella salsifontis TaxID=1365950 RepID=A0A1T4S8R2_9HYPH|nr:SIR2 family protein [Consotaella salsifontis]SKA24582.1 SIR2-like domain-containing protein [Consotaella salsifontis]
MCGTASLDACLDAVRGGTLIPYLGAGVAALGRSTVPSAPTALAALLENEVRAPKRASGNLWAVAQFVESRRFRGTLDAIVERAFAGGIRDNPVHDWLAAVAPPLVIDTWYDDGLLAAYAERAESWGWVQGATRNGQWTPVWTRAYDAAGELCPEGPDPRWNSLIYKPHGVAKKGLGFLMSDSDYVEVLTEIDIQTPIPDEVKARRERRGFLFLGCRFDDQMLRIFARQIMKRSAGPHFALIAGDLTRMERRFLDEQGIERIDLDLTAATKALTVAA